MYSKEFLDDSFLLDLEDIDDFQFSQLSLYGALEQDSDLDITNFFDDSAEIVEFGYEKG